MNTENFADPFHRGEQEIQRRLGIRDAMRKTGQRAVRPWLIDQHRAFFEQIPLVYYGASDSGGQIWASLLCGTPGFIRSPDRQTLAITATPVPGDPVFAGLQPGDSIGLLGLIFQTRRRNRANGQIESVDSGNLTIRVHQSFGNCPKYIQKRALRAQAPTESPADEPMRSDRLSPAAVELINQADTFFIATRCPDEDDSERSGVDMSHRGGKPGFVRVEDDRTLIWPDYAGNQFFNTLGNLVVDPHSGLLFMNFETGDLLFPTGRTEIIWSDEADSGFAGAERLLRFTLSDSVHAASALTLQWSAPEMSPFLDTTGTRSTTDAAR